MGSRAIVKLLQPCAAEVRVGEAKLGHGARPPPRSARAAAGHLLAGRIRACICAAQGLWLQFNLQSRRGGCQLKSA